MLLWLLFCILRVKILKSAMFVVRCSILRHFILSFGQDDICPESNKTRVEVSRCPESIQSINDSSKKKNCGNYQKCTGQQLVYHCMIFKERFVEVCAPRTYIIGMLSKSVFINLKCCLRKLNWFVKKNCVVYQIFFSLLAYCFPKVIVVQFMTKE